MGILDDFICVDVDECKIDGDTRCREGTYCYNTLGSFSCRGKTLCIMLSLILPPCIFIIYPVPYVLLFLLVDCDKACKKICNGPGPVKCAECATGYTRNEHGVCRGQ